MEPRYSKTFRVILIDPYLRSITEHQVAGSDMKLLVPAQSHHMFRIADYGQSMDYGVVDGAALTREKPIHAFEFRGFPAPIGGRCLVYGASKLDGKTCDAMFSVEVLRTCVCWVGRILPRIKQTNKRAVVIWRRI
jgi:hypothetical protein